MTSPKFDRSDEWLLGELKAATTDAAAEPVAVPAGAREAAQAMFTWRAVEDELILTLWFDSAVDTTSLVRGASANARMLTFQNQNQDLGVDLEIDNGHLTGQLLPPRTGTVRIVTTHGHFAATTADNTGCFVLPRPPHGPVRLQYTTHDGPTLHTEWLPI